MTGTKPLPAEVFGVAPQPGLTGHQRQLVLRIGAWRHRILRDTGPRGR